MAIAFIDKLSESEIKESRHSKNMVRDQNNYIKNNYGNRDTKKENISNNNPNIVKDFKVDINTNTQIDYNLY